MEVEGEVGGWRCVREEMGDGGVWSLIGEGEVEEW